MTAALAESCPAVAVGGLGLRAGEAVLVGLSGGVDSSVAALTLKHAGHPVSALYMHNWDGDEAGPCTADSDALDARKIALALQIPLRIKSFAREYWDRVFERFLAELTRGRTPNPDVLCNREVKFDRLLAEADSLGIRAIATGHYARTAIRDGRVALLRATDEAKDQSYFLYLLGQRELERTSFPIGGLRKPALRRIAAEAGFVTADKRDSTGICFIGEREFGVFVDQYLTRTEGPMTDPDGRRIGTHRGLHHYTLGQRGGLGLGGQRGGSGEPWFVVGKDPNSNTLIVAQGQDHPLLYAQSLAAIDVHWCAGSPPTDTSGLTAKIRYRQNDRPLASLELGPGTLRARFASPERALTPGQSIVIYRDDECLGGGIIDRTDHPLDPCPL